MPAPWQSTAALLGQGPLGPLVDALAAAPYEASAVGFAGTPSRAWVAFEALHQAATTEQLLPLLRHQCFTVRALVAEHLAEEHPTHAAALAELVRDTAQVWKRSGCLMDSTSLSAELLDALEPHRALAEVRALLQQVVADATEPALRQRVEALLRA